MELRYIPPRPPTARRRREQVITAWTNVPGIFGGCVLIALGVAALALGTVLGVPPLELSLEVLAALAILVRWRTHRHVIAADEHTIVLMSDTRTSMFQSPSGRTTVHPRSVRLVHTGIAIDRWAVGQLTVSTLRSKRPAIQRLLDRVTRVSV